MFVAGALFGGIAVALAFLWVHARRDWTCLDCLHPAVVHKTGAGKCSVRECSCGAFR